MANSATEGKSYFPWTPGRSSTPNPTADEGSTAATTTTHEEAPWLKKSLTDHAVSITHGLPRKDYPPDCPALSVQWYHAVDVSNASNDGISVV